MRSGSGGLSKWDLCCCCWFILGWMGSDQHAQFMLSTVFGVGNGGSMAAEGGYAVNFNWINTHNLYYQRCLELGTVDRWRWRLPGFNWVMK